MADLLRALHTLPQEQWALAADVLGFEPKDAPPPADEVADLDEEVLGEPLARTEAASATADQHQSGAELPAFWRLASDLHAPPEQPAVPKWLQDAAAEPIPSSAFEADPLAPPPDPAPLAPPGRLARFLYGHLTRERPGPQLHVRAAVARVARGQACHPLPLRHVRRWPHRVDLVRERRADLAPLQPDLARVQQQLSRLLGRRLRVLTPREGSRDPGWLVDAKDPAQQARRAGAGDAPVLVLGAADLLAADEAVRAAWRRFAEPLKRAGRPPLLVAPLPRRMVPNDGGDAFRVVLLDESVRLRLLPRRAPHLPTRRDEPPRGAMAELSVAARVLLGLVAGATFVPATLLRAVRRALPRDSLDGADVGAELEVFRHLAETQDGLACRVPAHEVPEAIAALATLLPDEALRDRLRLLAQELFEQGSPLVAAARTQAQKVLHAGTAEFKEAQAAADQAATHLFKQMAAQLHRAMQAAPDQPADADGLGHFLRWAGRTTPALIGQGGPEIQTAWALAQARRLRRGDCSMPLGLRIGQLAWLLDPPNGPPQALVLQATRDGVQLEVMPETQAPPGVLARGLPAAGRFDVALVQAGSLQPQPHGQPGRSIVCPVATGGIGVALNIAGRRLELERFSRPDWLARVERVGEHWFGVLPDARHLRWVARRSFRVAGGDGKASFELPHGAWWDDAEYTAWAEAAPAIACPRWANAGHGVDSFGYWADFRIGEVVQRMRFVSPGEFEMGSNDEEDSPRLDASNHRVAVTRAFWIAETATTQGLWQAVLGANPSRFTGEPDLPVELVSWEDVNGPFLRAVQRQLGDQGLRLATEAEWEYAAREAGHARSLRYWWGDDNSPDDANYASRGTVPVNRHRRNACGLWILGNLWEWVQDVAAEYPMGMGVDPAGPKTTRGPAAFRVLRSGGWISGPRNLLLASRQVGHARSVHFGFRLARGLPEAGAGEAQRAEPAVHTDGAAEPRQGAGGGAPGPAAP